MYRNNKSVLNINLQWRILSLIDATIPHPKTKKKKKFTEMKKNGHLLTQ